MDLATRVTYFQVEAKRIGYTVHAIRGIEVGAVRRHGAAASRLP